MSYVLTQNVFLCLNLTKVRWTSCKPTSFVRQLETLKGSVLRICWRCQRELCASGYEVEAYATKRCYVTSWDENVLLQLLDGLPSVEDTQFEL